MKRGSGEMTEDKQRWKYWLILVIVIGLFFLLVFAWERGDERLRKEWDNQNRACVMKQLDGKMRFRDAIKYCEFKSKTERP